MSGGLRSSVKRYTAKRATLAVDTVQETIENETKNSKVSSDSIEPAEILQLPFNLKSFCFPELQTATGNFHSMVGRRSRVFKGWVDAKAIAVKRVDRGLYSYKEWLTEVNSVGQLHHQNLVRLIGYCLEDRGRLLVYEFMPRGSLDDHLFGSEGSFRSQPLPWNLRIKIALGAAKGLAFLHSDEAKVIHGSFKMSKILLDSKLNPKLSGYGWAREGHLSDLQYSDCRYAAAYFEEFDPSPQIDVYNFGVVLLEILTGRRAYKYGRPWEETDLVLQVKRDKFNSEKKVRQILDVRFEGQYPFSGACKALELAISCLSADPGIRPDMTEVVKVFEQLESSSDMVGLGISKST